MLEEVSKTCAGAKAVAPLGLQSSPVEFGVVEGRESYRLRVGPGAEFRGRTL
jgi:hypothetical protein